MMETNDFVLLSVKIIAKKKKNKKKIIEDFLKVFFTLFIQC